jgi:GxxExxY protein
LSTKDTKEHEEEKTMAGELLFKDEVYAVVGAAIEVHRELNCGFLESVYQEALEMELRDRQIKFTAQQPLRISYKGRLLEKNFVADLICFDCILVELKAMDRLSGKEEAQILNYLKATGLRVGLVINFGDPGRLDWKRFVR